MLLIAHTPHWIAFFPNSIPPSLPLQARRISAVTVPSPYPIEGELLKLSKTGKWQRRWFKTHSNYLLYQRRRGGEYLGGIDLGPGSTVELVMVDGVKSVLLITGLDGDAQSAVAGEAREQRVFDLKLSTAATPSLKEWHRTLTAAQRTLAPADIALEMAPRLRRQETLD